MFVAAIILTINAILRIILRGLIDLEGHKTYSSREYAKIRKIWRSQFFIEGPLLVAVSLSIVDFYGPNGFIYAIGSVMLGHIIVTPLIFPFAEIPMLQKLIKRNKVKKFVRGQAQGPVVTLEQSSEYWLKPNFKMAQSAIRQIRNYGLAMFVLPFFPFMVVFYLVLSIEFYWVAKFVLVKRSNKLIAYDSRLFRKLIDELFVCVGLFVVGCIVRDSVFNFINLRPFEIRGLHLLLLGLILILYFTRAKNIVKFFLPPTVLSNQTYFETVQQDPNSYYLSNPAYPKDMLLWRKEKGPLENAFSNMTKRPANLAANMWTNDYTY